MEKSGKIPNYEEVIGYGEYILKYIFSILKELRKNNEDAIQEIISYKLIEKNKTIKTNNISKIYISIIISVNSVEENYGKKSFEEVIEGMKRICLYK